MKLHRKHIFAVLGVALLCAAVSSSALTLGRARGAVLLGQALKLTVPIRMESGEGSSALCFEADVFYGDTRQDAGRVGVTSEYSAPSQSANVYVTSLANVDEPVVTVYLRAGCDSKTTRRYVLLADLATEVTPQLRTAIAPLLPSIPPPVPAIQVASEDKGIAAAGRLPKRANTVIPEGKQELALTVKPKPGIKNAGSRRPRLQLVPVDLAEVRDPALKLSNELVLGDGEDLYKRAQAVALWRSLNATAQDVLSTESRRQSMESDLKGLRDVTTKNLLMLDELSRRLEKAESERYANPLVYALAAVLLLCCAGLAYAWIRLRRGGLAVEPWWRDDGGYDKSDLSDVGHDVVPGVVDGGLQPAWRSDAPSTRPPDTVTEKPATAVTEVDIDLHMEEPSGFLQERLRPGEKKNDVPSEPVRTVSKSSGHPDFAHSMTATLRSVNTREMLDVRQQAEFFMTLGQHEEAITMLRESIDAGSDANPLVYLDLLKILHTLGRKGEFNDYRSGFNAIFSGHVPAYDDFNQGGAGLEAYPEVCRRIASQWPSEEAVAYIENCLIRLDGEDAAQGFDLQAFRDLLLLHGVARRIASSLDSGFLPFSAVRTVSTGSGADFSPGAVDGDAWADDTQPVSVPAGATSQMAVDVDLSEPPGNLIDFDTADLFPSRKGAPEQ